MAGGATPSGATIEQVIGVQLQTSSYGRGLPIVFGTARIAANVIWYGEFKSFEVETPGGKGGNQPTDHVYTASVIFAVGEGPIAGILRVWRDKEVWSITQLIEFTVFVGNRTQTPWSRLTSLHPSEAVGYAGTAIICCLATLLGSSGQLRNHSFEVKGFNVIGSGNPDAHPSDIITALLADSFFGAGWPSGRVGDLVTGSSSYKTYCIAAGFYLSTVISEQRPTLQHLQEILDSTNAAAVWSQGVLKVIPYGDVAVGSYVPNTTPIYDLGVDDFLVNNADDDPITIDRASQGDTFNSCPVEYVDRLLDYNTSVIEDPDPVDVEAFGLRKESTISLRGITTAAMALQISRIRAQRKIYERNLYTFRLGWKYILLEPMDLITLTEPTLGLDHRVVRVRSIDENDDGDLTVTASDWPFGIASATLYTPQPGPATGTNAAGDPGNVNAPVIFDAPELLTDGEPMLMLATSGGADWGGAQVWVSFDGSTYSKVGSITGPARHGVLTATLATGGTNDTTHTLAVDLSVSGGELVTASAQDKEDLVTLCWVDGELLAFQTAALTGTNAYNLTTLRRGTHGSPIGAHSSGTKFVRIDDAVFRYRIPTSRLGSVLYVKLQSFNQYGGGLQDLSAVTAYSFTPAAADIIPPYPSAVSIAIQSTPPSPVAGQRRHKVWDDDGGFSFDGGGDPILKKNTFVTVGWTYTNPYPASLLYKFRIVLYTGTDPNDQSKYMIPPEMVDPNVSSIVLAFSTPQVVTTCNAAVQAVYLGGTLESSWRTSSGSVNADPDTLPVGTTADYAEDGSGNPTAGAQLVPGSTRPLKLGPSGCQIGQFILDEPVLRSMNLLRRNVASDRYWYGGNCDGTVRTGAPDIAKLTVKRREWSTAGTRGRLELKLQPTSATDNIEAMRYAKIEWFRQSAAGTTATLTALDTTYEPIPDRIFYAPGTDSDANNASFISAVLHDTGITSGFPACKVTIYNAFGPSDTHCFYAAAANADGSTLTDNGTSWPAGITGGSGGGTGGGGDPGGYCVAPDTPIMLASGRHVPAGALRIGDLVWTLPEGGSEWGAYPVVAIEPAEAEAFRLTITDGRSITASEGHRLLSRSGWNPARDFHPGDVIDGLMPGVVGAVKPVGRMAVLRITVERAHTYLTDRLLSHNAKPINP